VSESSRRRRGLKGSFRPNNLAVWGRNGSRGKKGNLRRPEWLEPRCLLAGDLGPAEIVVQPAFSNSASSASAAPPGLSPAAIRHAYGFDQIALHDIKGNPVTGNGAGQTIAIVDAYDDPKIASDLHAFDVAFNLPDPPSLTVQKQLVGGKPPTVDGGWGVEIALDVEWAHAIAPGAKIVLAEAYSSSLNNLLTMVDWARNQTGVSAISMSWGTSEFNGETSYDSHFTTPPGHTGITFVGASGDWGKPGIWPAYSPNVLAVGGTTLHLSTTGNYASEAGWSGSGGGTSTYEHKPSFQNSFDTTNWRDIPDVSYDADPGSGVAVYDTLNANGWFVVGGTSAAAPQWAALVAIADEGRVLAGNTPLSGAQSVIDQLPAGDFHDIRTGNNGYAATGGYDLVTGRGTPLANAVVQSLVAYNVSGSTMWSGASSGLFAQTGVSGAVQIEMGAITSDGSSNQGTSNEAVFAELAPGAAVPMDSTAGLPLLAAGQSVFPVLGGSGGVAVAPPASLAAGRLASLAAVDVCVADELWTEENGTSDLCGESPAETSGADAAVACPL
jgi:subtilase family serine protease